MTYVITFPCIGVKDASCVDVCPVDCIHPTPYESGFQEAEHLFINPNECINCGACETACPVTAIFEETAVPAQWTSFITKNADYYKGSPQRARRMNTCMCGPRKSGYHATHRLTRTVSTQVVLVEPRRKVKPSGSFTPFTPFVTTRVVLVDRNQRSKDR